MLAATQFFVEIFFFGELTSSQVLPPLPRPGSSSSSSSKREEKSFDLRRRHTKRAEKTFIPKIKHERDDPIISFCSTSVSFALSHIYRQFLINFRCAGHPRSEREKQFSESAKRAPNPVMLSVGCNYPGRDYRELLSCEDWKRSSRRYQQRESFQLPETLTFNIEWAESQIQTSPQVAFKRAKQPDDGSTPNPIDCLLRSHSKWIGNFPCRCSFVSVSQSNFRSENPFYLYIKFSLNFFAWALGLVRFFSFFSGRWKWKDLSNSERRSEWKMERGLRY